MVYYYVHKAYRSELITEDQRAELKRNLVQTGSLFRTQRELERAVSNNLGADRPSSTRQGWGEEGKGEAVDRYGFSSRSRLNNSSRKSSGKATVPTESSSSISSIARTNTNVSNSTSTVSAATEPSIAKNLVRSGSGTKYDQDMEYEAALQAGQ